MAWNPFRAIGNAIGNARDSIGNAVRGIFERETPTPEQVPTPAPTIPEEPPIVEQAPPTAPVVEEAPTPEERGFNLFGSIKDFVTNLFEREREAPTPETVQEAPRESAIEGAPEIEQAPAVEPVEEVEQAPAFEPTVPEEEVGVEQAPTLEPTVPEVAPVEPGVPAEEEPLLPKFIEEPTVSYTERDDLAFGADSDFTRNLNEAVANFIADREGLEGLSQSAQEWLLNATISEIFDKYWDNPAGFSAEHVLENMQSIVNIHIRELDDGSIEVEFDYESDDGSESGHVVGHAHARA